MTQFKAPIKKPTRPTLDILLDNLQAETFTLLNCVKIGVVKAFHPGSASVASTVDVQIAYQQITEIDATGKKSYIEYPLLLNVPVSFQQGGGVIHTFPIAAGDECVVLFNDQQLDAWLVSGPGLPPTFDRVHDFSDAIAIVGLRNNTRGVAGVSTTTSQLRSVDGSTYIELDPIGQIVNIVAPGGVNIDTPVVAVTGDVVAGTISLIHHLHSGVVPGGGNTGEPVP